ncbi:unnamed protein product, partial [Tenebrio molitor]
AIIARRFCKSYSSSPRGLQHSRSCEFSGFARSSVHRAVLRFRQTGGYTRRPGSGRRRSTSARDNRYIAMLSLRNRHMTAVKLRNQLERVREVNVNERTVR